MNDSNAVNVLEKIYNALKKESLYRTAYWTVGNVKFYEKRLAPYCTFDILPHIIKNLLASVLSL